MSYGLRASLIIATIILFFPTYSKSEVIEQNSKSLSIMTFYRGQSFKATTNGTIKTIHIDNQELYNGDIIIYAGEYSSGIPGSEGTYIHKQTISLPQSESINNYYSEITLANDVHVTKDSYYSIIFTGASHLWVQDNNPYTDGHHLVNYTVTHPNWDLRFKVTQVPAIPTISEWTLVLLGLSLVGGTSALLLRRRTKPI